MQCVGVSLLRVVRSQLLAFAILSLTLSSHFTLSFHLSSHICISFHKRSTYRCASQVGHTSTTYHQPSSE